MSRDSPRIMARKVKASSCSHYNNIKCFYNFYTLMKQCALTFWEMYSLFLWTWTMKTVSDCTKNHDHSSSTVSSFSFTFLGFTKLVKARWRNNSLYLCLYIFDTLSKYQQDCCDNHITAALVCILLAAGIWQTTSSPVGIYFVLLIFIMLSFLRRFSAGKQRFSFPACCWN